jgi:predicted nuclease of restriction endonuclease-like (RecB) superfamily
MSDNDLVLPDDYERVLAHLKHAVSAANLRALQKVNTELLGLYWTVGHTIAQQEKRQGWGARVVERLASDLRTAYPHMKGFSPRNVRYMRTFARQWPDRDAMLQRPVATLGWGSVTTLIDGLDDTETRDWYAAQAVANGWSRPVLLNQIKSQLHVRLGSAPSNLPSTMPEDSDLARQLTKDPLILGFLDLGGQVSERRLEDAFMHRLERFMLELGRGFSFVGRQVPLEVGGDEFFVDLLFFHIPSLRYVVLELKIEKARPGHLGQLDFYVTVVDEQLRDARMHSPTVGILLCPEKNDVVVEYALRGRSNPLSVNRYTPSASFLWRSNRLYQARQPCARRCRHLRLTSRTSCVSPTGTQGGRTNFCA